MVLGLGVALALAAPAHAGGAGSNGPTVSALAQKPYLSVLLDPSTLPASRSTVSALYLELLGPGGNAVTLGTPTPVALASSDPSVAAVPRIVRIPADAATIVVPVTTGGKPGSTTIAARAEGLASSEATLTTTSAGVASTGGSIKLTVSPATFFRGSAGPAWATAELLNSGGKPEVARSAVTLALISSAPGVLRPPPAITVAAGAYVSTVPLRIGGNGAVTLAALGDGYNPGIVATRVDVAGSAPASLRATLQPGLLLPGTVPRLVLQAVDSRGTPVAFPCGPVFLASNTPSVLDVPTRVTPSCTPASEAVIVDAGPAASSGTTSITVAESGLTPATVTARVAATASAALAASVAPFAFAYGASPEGWLVLQTVGGKGEPEDAVTPVTITLAGGTGAVPARVTLPAGSSTVAVPVTGVSAGQAPIVVAAAAGFRSAPITLTPIARPPARGSASGSLIAALTVLGQRIALRWIFLAQVVMAASLGLGLLVSARRRKRPGGS